MLDGKVPGVVGRGQSPRGLQVTLQFIDIEIVYDASASVHAVNVRRRFQLGIRRDWASEMLLSD